MLTAVFFCPLAPVPPAPSGAIRGWYWMRPPHHPALLTMGEGYHNFHHQFPMDYRNAIKWYQFDPTKWFIAVCGALGLASHLHVFPENEIRKGALAMQLKKLKKEQDGIRWPVQVDDLPVVGWDKCECSPSVSDRLSYIRGSRMHGFAWGWGAGALSTNGVASGLRLRL